MSMGVVYQSHVHMVEGTVVSHTVLLKHLGVQDRDLEAPHHGNCPQHDLITPEPPLLHFVKVNLKAEGTAMGCSKVINAVGSPQRRPHIHTHLLSVRHHPVDDLAPKVSVRIVWQIPGTIHRSPTVMHLEALPNDRKQTIAIAFNLENNQYLTCLLYTSPSPRDATLSRMPSSA